MENFKTTDLSLASAISLSSPIKTIDFSNPKRATFVFERNNSLDALVERYWDGNLLVDPKAFFNQIKTLKTRLYGGK